ncbi:hypothetical protein VE03_07601 [Pseudogymnoascus sp. 23342-1-I1]|nr:hypothetical protein VE03_07601 [Pseudogymnoascus sp. 23342-1-I1]
MKSVCIIGAGPGGLVAAKTFLQRGFKVTVYEKDDKVGGIWAFPKRSESDGYLSSRTPTNLSKFTVGFSDLSWQSLETGDSHVPMFPAAAQVGQYLELYRDRYVPSSTFKLQHRVVSADRVEEGDGHRWKVVAETKADGTEPGDPAGANTKQQLAYFDYVINAAGFFSKPSIPSRLIPPSETVKEVHTSQFRELDDLFIERSSHTGTNILVYGGGNSAGEVASNIAFQLSSSQYSPNAATHNSRFEGVKVYHVTPRPLYAVPPYVPGDSANTFIPLDFKIYELKWRQPGPIVSSSGPLAPEVAAARYTAIYGVSGDQKGLGAEALVTTEETTPYATLSESYAEFVRSGLIIPIAGRVSGYKEQDLNTVTAIVTTKDGTSTLIPNIAASVIASGYTPTPALSFLSAATKQALSHDPTSPRLPILLQNYQTLHPALPDLGFIGFYEGPYWGVMEMQARLLAARWSETGGEVPPHPDESLERLRELRQAMGERRSDVPQYWFSDYIGYLEEIASALGLERNDDPFPSAGTGPISPARYLASTDAHGEAMATMADLEATLYECENGRFRARAAFRALQGRWLVERRVESKRVGLPPGVFVGTGTFHPRAPTKTGVDLEYLYIEEGDFSLTTGEVSEASRRSVYRYTEETDTLSEWVVCPGDWMYRDHELVFGEVGDGACTARACIERSRGLGVEDEYRTDYLFEFRAVALGGVEVRFEIGREGEYVSVAAYRRPGEVVG